MEPESRATPHFVHSLVGHCVESSSLPAYQETPENDAIQYVVELSTGNLNEHVAPLGGTPLWSAGSPFLGGRRLIKSIATNATAVVVDVNACVADAAGKGVFDTSTTRSGSKDTWQTESSQTTIRPMLDRFDQCLLVEDGMADGDARVAPGHR